MGARTRSEPIGESPEQESVRGSGRFSSRYGIRSTRSVHWHRWQENNLESHRENRASSEL